MKYISFSFLLSPFSSFKKTIILLLLSLTTLGFSQTTQELVGRLILMGFRGNTAAITQLLRYKPAGFVFYPSNISSTEKVRAVIQDLQANVDYPLLFALDQEGGPFSAYRVDNATIFPSNMAIAATNNIGFAKQKGQLIGSEIAYAGFNLNFAPVVDVNINPDNPIIGMRSFGANVNTVSSYAVALLEGLNSVGVAGVAKHFPGHGDTITDSHLALPIVTGNRERLDAVELAPFKAMIAANVPAIMTAHVIFSEFDNDYPATLSKTVLTDLLRDELGFEGMIITDHMDMSAIANNYGAGEAAVLSIIAGADVVMIGYREERQAEVYEALLEAVLSGRISQERLLDAVNHSSFLANKFKSNLNKPVPDYQTNRATAEEQALKAATLLTNDGILPIKTDSQLLVISPYIKRIKAVPALADNMAYYYPTSSLEVSIDPSEFEIATAVEAAKDFDLVVLATYHFRGKYLDNVLRLEQALINTNKPLVVVALGNPDDIRYFETKPNAYLALYGFDDSNLKAAREILSGNAWPQGKLPMGFEGFNYGFGLENFR